jgi:hypothetical protein
MNNPQHVKINEVMKNLNPKIYKSRNQFLVEAAIFYIEHYGEDAFMEHEEGIEKEYLSREDLESLKAELIETAMKEARQEVIRVLGGVISGMQVTQPVNVAAASQPEEYGQFQNGGGHRCVRGTASVRNQHFIRNGIDQVRFSSNPL